jgi:hypothetical protein
MANTESAFGSAVAASVGPSIFELSMDDVDEYIGVTTPDYDGDGDAGGNVND